MKRTKRNAGFTLLEAIAALSILLIILGGAVWKIPKLKQNADTNFAVHRAMLICTAKQAFLRSYGARALELYGSTSTDEEKFKLIRHNLPFSNNQVSLENFTPKGYIFRMNEIDEKVSIFTKTTPLYY